MALYLNFRRVMKFPAVINVYHKANKLWADVKKGAAYARIDPLGAAYSRQNSQLDVAAPVTGVPVLKRNGHR
jgi:hypothetical protein